jgi:zona occludens toxin (predicted ATPase)
MLAGRAHDLSTAKSIGRTGSGNTEGAAWNEAVPAQRVVESSSGICAGHHGVELDTLMESLAAAVKRPLIRQRDALRFFIEARISPGPQNYRELESCHTDSLSPLK